MFIPLHVKSDYSLAYGTASIEELIERAAALGYRSLALTDLENLYGQVRFHHQCRLHRIHPITGLELRPSFEGRHRPGSKAGRLVLLAMDDSGYRSLCRIVSRRRGGVRGSKGEASGDPVPVAEQHAEGLFALSDDMQVVERLVNGGTFPRDRIGLLLVRPLLAAADAGAVDADAAAAALAYAPAAAVADAAAAAAGRLGVGVVADLDAVFLHREDHALHVLQVAMGQGRLMNLVARGRDVESPDRWLRSPEEVAELFNDFPQALRATVEIAGACTFEIGAEEGTAHIFNPEARARDAARLRQLCEEGLAETRHVGKTKEYQARLDEELAVIDDLNFSGFMLIVADILAHCRDNGILAAVRGSAVSSLVIHLLGGSPVDPVPHGLLFERFLHAGKTAWPDVDIDLPWDRRDEVIERVYHRFGKDRVAMVAAHHTFRLRSALREGLKAWGAPESLIESMSRKLPSEDLATDDVDFLDVAAPLDEPERPERLAGLEGEGRVADILPMIRRLVGRPRHIAVHPGGIVIDWRPLQDLLPLEMAPKGVVVTQYDLVAVAKLGLVKIDLLGNRCLSEIEETLTLAGWERPLRLSAIPAEDRRTLDLIDRAETIGCFQLESPAMRSLLARLPIRSQSDLIAALALIRPGASAGEVKNTFVRRARGEEKKDLAFPVLADRLKETHGLPIYEEDIMLLLARTGGVTLAEADELRRGIVKSGGDSSLLSSLQAEFLGTAEKKYPADKAALARARRAWSVAARFAAYSFNKAHAASYGLLSYYSAYLKVHHPVEFTCALLNHHQGLYPLRSVVSEFMRMGIELSGPHVNRSEYCSGLSEGAAGGKIVRVGLDKVKSLSRKAALQIVAERKGRGEYATLRDLLERVRLGIHEVAALVISGACDGLSPLETGNYPFIHEAVVERLRQKCDLNDLDTIRAVPLAGGTPAEEERVRRYQALVRVKNELNYLGMHLSAHPVALLRQEAERYRCLPISKAIADPAERTVRLAAIVAAMRRVVTRQGPMQFITFEDETGVLEAVVFPVVYRQLGERVTTPGPFLVEGKLRIQQGAVHLEVGLLEPFHHRNQK